MSLTVDPCRILLEVGTSILGWWDQPLFSNCCLEEQRWFCKCLSKSFWGGIQLCVTVYFAQVIIFNHCALPVRKLKCGTVILARALYKALCFCQSQGPLIVILTIALFSRTRLRLFRKHPSPDHGTVCWNTCIFSDVCLWKHNDLYWWGADVSLPYWHPSIKWLSPHAHFG